MNGFFNKVKKELNEFYTDPLDFALGWASWLVFAIVGVYILKSVFIWGYEVLFC